MGNVERLEDIVLFWEANNKSSNILISVIKIKSQYSDTLNRHFRVATWTRGSRIIGFSQSGCEALKNEEFDLIIYDTLRMDLAQRIPQPYDRGIIDERVDLFFMATIDIENMIDDLLRDSRILLNVVEGKRSKITQALERIIILSQPND